MTQTSSAGWFVVVAALWGATNPFIKQGSKGIEKIKTESKFLQFIAELNFLFLNWKYLVPFLLNQTGSVVYYITLGSTDISLAVPITNSLTFVFTILSGRLLGEKIKYWETYIGMVLVLAGVALCVTEKF